MIIYTAPAGECMETEACKHIYRDRAQWRDRELASHQWPGSIPAGRHVWVEFVVGSHPCSEGFSPGFFPPQKPIPIRSGKRATGLSG